MPHDKPPHPVHEWDAHRCRLPFGKWLSDLLQELVKLEYQNIHHHKHIRYVVLVCDNKFAVVLKPHERIIIMQSLTVGHADTLTIVYLDQNGNPMLTPVAPDASPAIAWTNTPAVPPVDTLTVSPDGSTAVVQALAAGTDSISVAVSVSGTVYAASDVINIVDVAQVLTSVKIAHAVV